jgi:hypothetical protein
MSADDGEIFLRGPAGRLEALLKRHPGARAAALVCHPHPQHGGTMYNKVAYRAGRALSAAGLTVLRFNFRGVGASEGRWDEGRGEREDVAAMLDHAARDHDNLVVAGFSFGAWVGLDVGARDPRVSRLVGIGLPVNVYDFGFLRAVGKPTLLVHGDRDTWGDVDRVRALAADAGPRARLEVLAGADHFFEMHLDALMTAVTAFARESPPPRGA